jgi:hypothetical protein
LRRPADLLLPFCCPEALGGFCSAGAGGRQYEDRNYPERLFNVVPGAFAGGLAIAVCGLIEGIHRIA